MSRRELLSRVGSYADQQEDRRDEIAREDRIERLEALDEEGPFPTGTAADVLGAGEVEQDEVQAGINSMIGSYAARAAANVQASQMSREQRLAYAITEQIERRSAELEDEQDDSDFVEATAQETAQLEEWLVEDDGDAWAYQGEENEAA